MPLLSLDPASILLGGVVLLFLWWWMSTRRPSGLPPGPGPALPLVGHLHLLDKDPRPQFWRWRRQYGDVFSLYMGGRLVVMLSSYSAIREALVTFADVFSDRPHNFLTETVFKNKGIVLSSGATWKEQRKAGLEILRAMGMGKNVLAEKIQEEVNHYIQAIKDHRGEPADLRQLTQVSVSNNICSIIFGKRFDYQDPEFISYVQALNRNFQLLSGTTLASLNRMLKYLPGNLYKGDEIIANIQTLSAFIDKNVAEHHRTLDKNDGNQEKSDFIYSYLEKIQEQKARGNVDSTLNDGNLQRSLLNLFNAGTETTSTTIQWTMLFFLHHPHVQDKCFKEVSEVIGLHRLPTMQDKPNLPYLEATIREVLRKADIVPLSVLHATSQDVVFRGFFIPKGTTVIPFISGVLQDPEIWGDPENFRPERFMDTEGKLIKREELIPFSTGRRVCLGESLARMELFLYLTTLIQNFHFLPAEEGQLPSLEGVFGLTYLTQPFKIRAVPRM